MKDIERKLAIRGLIIQDSKGNNRLEASRIKTEATKSRNTKGASQ